MKQIFTDHFTLLLWVSLMASSFVVSEQLLPYANPVASTALRFFLATSLMLPFIWKRALQQLNLKVLRQYAIISLFLVLFFLGLFEALKTTTAMRTSVIYTLLPLISVLLTYLALRIVTPNKQIIAFIIGTLGAVWVLLAFSAEKLSLNQWRLGDSIFLGACCCLALHVIFVKKWATDVSPAVGAFYIMFLGSLLLLPFLLLFGDLKNVAWQQAEFWQALIYLTVFATMATFFLQQHLLKRVGANRLLAFTYLIPTLVVIPQAMENTYQLYSGLPGIILTILALYLISQTSNKTSHVMKELTIK